MKLSIEEQLKKINTLRNDVQDNPKKYKVYDKPKFLKNNKWGIKLNLSIDYTQGMEGDALNGANDEEIAFYKGFLKYFYNAELIGDFENNIDKKDLAERKQRKNKRCEDIVWGNMDRAKVTGVLWPDCFSSLHVENHTQGLREGMDHLNKEIDTEKFNSHINKFDLSSRELDEFYFKASNKEANQFIAEDVEFKINELGHHRGKTLIEGLIRIFRLKQKATHMHEQNKKFNQKNKG